ncbi:HoxN/HupN/NixA family nickel/cobalt transporter [Cohnella sp. REN36]|uniref:HoxN/HupN/NixA family nickel/cobalt transporter n=1 Tax=Cohnella sp. REN36 TaxID=2887347 RepID=UPI001D156E6F|nr:HoxN/HupN/NixA family nickel/cobalt transporter [Cohnella sp. REN36]MCC3371735.1 HoxN/HupN/NixA family nickel/cobalt transporter [Cohnella sp. REN36]
MFRSLWQIRKSWSGYFFVVFSLHLAGMFGLLTAARQDAAFWSVGLLAYTLGLRHAFDADHIAAIDNTVRKLVEQQRSPLGVGFYFSLGHSSVVFIMVLAIAFSMHWVQDRLPEMGEIGGVIGASVSGLFLVVIGVLNLIVLLQLLPLFRRLREGRLQEDQLEALLNARGLFSRLLKPLYRFVSRSWHVYPLGFLFGLGFDTATEIGLLAISATAAQGTMPIFGILSLPLLFAAGMSLMDTADGMFMTSAYRWAFATPKRKLVYNAIVTSVSVAAALVIGIVELIQVLSEQADGKGPLLAWIAGIEFERVGYALVAVFVLAWLVSRIVWRRRQQPDAVAADAQRRAASRSRST